MKKPAAGHVAIKPPLRAGSWDIEPTRLVCAALVLALVTLAFRIASIW
jgi:hypothetical protein